MAFVGKGRFASHEKNTCTVDYHAVGFGEASLSRGFFLANSRAHGTGTSCNNGVILMHLSPDKTEYRRGLDFSCLLGGTNKA